MRRLVISKEGDGFLVDDPSLLGSPPVGRGKSMDKALGVWLRNNQSRLGIFIDVDPSARAAEETRREKELAQR
jgi:hypothetical protein